MTLFWHRHHPDAPATGLLAALRRLDGLLETLMRAAEAQGGVAAAALRGMFVSPEEAASLLARPPGLPVLAASATASLAEPLDQSGAFDELSAAFGLTPFDTDLLLIALAPELDLRYERIYGFLQDDTTQRRATVDLALSLRTAAAVEKSARLVHFAADAPLMRHGLLHLVPDPAHSHPPLLAHAVVVDPQVVGWLLGHAHLDHRLAAFCRLERPTLGLDGLVLPEATRAALRALGTRARAGATPLVLHLHGPPGAGRRAVAAGLAGEFGLPLLSAPAAVAVEQSGGLLGALLREARMRGAVLHLASMEGPSVAATAAALRGLSAALAAAPPFVVLAGREPWVAGGGDQPEVINVALALPDAAARRKLWARSTGARGLTVDADALDELASRFKLGAEQIDRAVADAAARGRWSAAVRPGRADGARTDLFAGARAQSGRALAALAPKAETTAGWNDLVLPPEETAQLREFCEQGRLRHYVLDNWGFGRTPAGTRGLNGLFAGPPGTGKTMAARVIAGDLGLDLYCVDLAQVVSKYIGETQKNLDQIFRAAEGANAVLMFDEADALFGKRSEVHDAHDRYANLEIAYLLQKMEAHEGIAILATNLRQNLDPAFLRRLHSVVEFPFPDTEHRRRIWQVTFPPEAPLAPDVELEVLAREVKLAGGNIRNIAMAAAVRAAAEGGAIAMRHLTAAARREYQKLGRDWAGTAA
jgi:hypothetical protein